MSIAVVIVALRQIALVAFGVTIWIVNNVEQPAYDTVEHDGDIEVRDYPALVVAE